MHATAVAAVDAAIADNQQAGQYVPVRQPKNTPTTKQSVTSNQGDGRIRTNMHRAATMGKSVGAHGFLGSWSALHDSAQYADVPAAGHEIHELIGMSDITGPCTCMSFI